MKPIAESFGDVTMPPTDPRYVDGAPGSRVPSVSGLSQDSARERIKESGFQVADQANLINSASPYGTVVGTSPGGQTVPGSIITILISNGIPPAPPPPPPGPSPPPDGEPPPAGSTVVEIPGLPPITVPAAGASAAAVAVTVRTPLSPGSGHAMAVRCPCMAAASPALKTSALAAVGSAASRSVMPR